LSELFFLPAELQGMSLFRKLSQRICSPFSDKGARVTGQVPLIVVVLSSSFQASSVPLKHELIPAHILVQPLRVPSD
jgi:hypothetical protein